MKKLMIAAAALAACFAATADGITSSNTVGFQSYALDLENPDDYVHNIGVQFGSCNKVDSDFVITDSIFGSVLSDGDVIFIFDPVFYGYTLYTFCVDGDKTFFTVMFADGSLGDEIASLSVNKGDNLLYMPVNLENTFSVAGEVEASGTKELEFTLTDEDYIFPITNPFPMDTKMSDMTCLDDGDVIFIWDSFYYGYTLLTYCIDGDNKFFTVMYADGSLGEEISDPSTVIFPAGQGGLYMPAGDRTWSVTYNY